MRELKHQLRSIYARLHCRTPPGVRELKLGSSYNAPDNVRRTPPGVRELKHAFGRVLGIWNSRTPPGVRELKLWTAEVR